MLAVVTDVDCVCVCVCIRVKEAAVRCDRMAKSHKGMADSSSRSLCIMYIIKLILLIFAVVANCHIAISTHFGTLGTSDTQGLSR